MNYALIILKSLRLQKVINMATRLFVGNLPTTTKEYELHAAFSSYGEIKNVDLKTKSSGDDDNNKFAFVTISGSNCDIESCIKHFLNEDFNGKKLYVTRARESFLERLQRERLEVQQKETEKAELGAKKTPSIKLGNKLNPHKRKIDNDTGTKHKALDHTKSYGTQNFIQNDESETKKKKKDLKTSKKNQDLKLVNSFNPVERINEIDTGANQKASYQTNTNVNTENGDEIDGKNASNVLEMYKKKQESEAKRMRAMIKKAQEFKQKQMIVKTGLTGVDKVSNKKIIFSDNEESTPNAINSHSKRSAKTDKKNTLFDDDDDDDNSELNFEIKKQYEGKKGQKVLDLQSRYKSDKRFVLDERFIEEEDDREETAEVEDQIEVNQIDEKDKQLNILQDVLGVAIKRKIPEEERDVKKKPKIGMLRFDPSQPEHAKFLAPIEETRQESTKKSKSKTKDKQIDETEIQEQKQEEPRPEVSKEQFYKVSETLKEAIAQPTSFSLRSLFQNAEYVEEDPNDEANYTPLKPPKKSKVKNPMEPNEKNPFIYDSSDSDSEELVEKKKTETAPAVAESKAVWKEFFFFGQSDRRFEEGLAFFNSANESEAHKERRELKSLVKKRIYNKERKNQMQMFQKKIGGRKKTMKKSFRRKS